MAILPNTWLTSSWYATLTGFVAVNTLLYVVLSVSKILPRVHPTTWFSRGGISRRRETRSIYPESMEPVDLLGGDT
jgi:uncharacterized membrane protein YecN with MAPEG domain